MLYRPHLVWQKGRKKKWNSRLLRRRLVLRNRRIYNSRQASLWPALLGFIALLSYFHPLCYKEKSIIIISPLQSTAGHRPLYFSPSRLIFGYSHPASRPALIVTLAWGQDALKLHLPRKLIKRYVNRINRHTGVYREINIYI
jgi:hypothetical protein